MKTFKIQLTKRQNNLLASRCPDETLVLLAKFGAMSRDLTYWVTEPDLKIITQTIGTRPHILRQSD